ncbi:MAG: hypothetical protein ACREV9_16630 [Burkholderiales bacterium]
MNAQETAGHRKLGWIKTTIFSLLPTVVLLVTAEIGLRIYVNYKAEARELARVNGVVLIDNAKFIDTLGRDKERLFFDTCHMHCEGNTLLAQNIARELEQQKLLH